MISSKLALAVTTTALLLTACPPSTNAFCVDSAKAACQLQFKCCTAVERQETFGQLNLAFGPYSNEGGCVDVFTRRCEAQSQAQDEAIAAGRLSFDEDRANECLTRLKDAANECDPNAFFNDDGGECANLVEGQVDDGDVCFGDEECAGRGSECEVDRNDDNDDGVFVVTLEGTCKGQGDEGEPCLPGGLCNDGLLCLVDDELFEQRCTPPAAVGALCGNDGECQEGLRCREDENFESRCTAPGGDGADCEIEQDCTEGLSCLPDENFDRFCRVPGTLGVSCNGNAECQTGLLCATGAGGGGQVCSTTSGVGEICPGGVAQCEPGLDCRFDDVNRCLIGASGDPCDNGERCGAGLLCRTNANQGRDECQPPLGLNDDCDDNNPTECDPNLRCLDPNGSFNFTCELPLAPDDPCSRFEPVDPCDATHFCAFDAVAGDDICVPRLLAGVDCNSNADECTQNLFCDATTDTCIGQRNENGACTDDDQCAGNLECRLNDANNANICRALSGNGGGCQVLDDCAAGLDCRFDDAGLRRICRGVSAPDQACEAQGDCAPGLDCRQNDAGTANICRPISNEDEGCDNELDCVPGLECRFDNATGTELCKGPAAAGEACGNDDQCEAGLVCRFDAGSGQQLCVALVGLDGTCTADGDCLAGLRCRDLDDTDEESVLVCTDKIDDGADCEASEDCLSGFCDPEDFFCTEAPPELDFEICDGL
ncbi:MAG: hypothetical protein Q8O67_17555 [Deltaproteobacteria bacterium]|nr:hypothetical protein [Deltaproteobacteria bacterium]